MVTKEHALVTVDGSTVELGAPSKYIGVPFIVVRWVTDHVAEVEPLRDDMRSTWIHAVFLVPFA